jgi:hypothetical protein
MFPGGDRRQLKEAAGQAAKQAAKQFAKKAVKALAKKAIAMAAPALVAILPYILGALAAVFFVAAVYSIMPQNWHLAGTEPQDEVDEGIRLEAVARVEEDNVRETWLRTPGGERRLGFLADRYGHDAEIANKWGDVYSPVLFLSMQSEEDKMTDLSWVKGQLKKISSDLRPFFYYKESTVTYHSKDGSDTVTVYLLTEADTIRGHYTYEYEWVTESHGKGSVTYEKFTGKKLAGASPWERLEKYLKGYLDLRDRDVPDTRRMVFEAAEGFTAHQEWVAWLDEVFADTAWASQAMIPPDVLEFFREAEKACGVPWWFLAGVGMVESGFNPLAENKDTGCFGIMQVSPENWQAYAPKLGFDPVRDGSNPRAQILVGAYILKGYLPSYVDWNGGWKEATLEALTWYAGFRTAGKVDRAAMERCRQEYASKVWSYAETFKSAPAAWPVPGYYEISSPFGWRIHPITGIRTFHEGIDIPAPEGAAVVSVSGGIAYTWSNPGYGNLVVVKDALYEYYYAHLSSFSVVSGAMIKPGDPIGAVGSTGRSTGPHLHFGVRKLDTGTFIDPLPFLRGVT